MLKIRGPKSHCDPEISCKCAVEARDPDLGMSPVRFYLPEEIMLSPAVSKLSGPQIIARAWVLHSLLSNLLFSAGCLQFWQCTFCRAPAVLNSFNPTVQGRHFGGCDNALRVPFESLVSELRDFAQSNFPWVTSVTLVLISSGLLYLHVGLDYHKAML